MSWDCICCQAVLGSGGIENMAKIILEDPEGDMGRKMMEAIYDLMVKHYGNKIEQDEFIKKSMKLIKHISSFEFVVKYPKHICEWFDRC